MQKKFLKIILCLGIVTFFVFAYYIAKDNNSIVVDNVVMKHKDLPKNFEGYKILQISDLHGREFGENQEKLINQINGLDYDLVLFTGDYVDKNKDLKPLEDLLKGINDDIPKYFVLGNADGYPRNSDLVKGHQFFDLFTKYNVKSLDYIGAEIKKDNESIWLTPREYYLYDDIDKSISELSNVGEGEGVDQEKLKLEQELLYERHKFGQEYSNTKNPFSINVTHQSVDIDKFPEIIKNLKELQSKDEEDNSGMQNKTIDWDMSISGHTHGGQVRMPFIGAVASPNSGFFPGEMNIKGVHYYGGRTQYVNSGLGASGPKFLRFRVFNTPSVGLIELKGQ
ncbi:metallophosphoesterase [Paraclostridium ghonii]|uniref:MPP superfamily phosphohydrolase n=1 Tax=Paraclostridium ghonii TaxID=29358 RepID=A0ABU0N468_9FIRM|nr:metallophosphoesterase [Paeniclostridium ghonii]MDQ0557952.1 putative MPP superfamily phosphohydrolase [Paeniclostridium ghonii]